MTVTIRHLAVPPFSLPRSPRPTICMYRTGLNTCRAMSTMSVFGASKPVDKTLWLHSTRTRPCWKRSRK